MRRAKRVCDDGTVSTPSLNPGWSELLVEAVTKPGIVSTAYSQFWSYSVGNQILALFQCLSRRLSPGPINTFLGWQEIGRQVKKGERALTLCMPVNVKRRTKHVDGAEIENSQEVQKVVQRYTGFVYRNHWFVLSQTEGAEYEPVSVPAWNEAIALHALNVVREPYEHTDGNCQGYARDRSVAVSPIAFLPHRTLFHEVAHVLLGHTEALVGGTVDGAETIPRNLREVEAECVAMICSESLGLAGAEFSRGYIQHWFAAESIPERSAQKIFKAADEILRAGRAGEPTP